MSSYINTRKHSKPSGPPLVATRLPTKRVYRYGPGYVRDNKDLKDAVALLAEHGRARLEVDGRRRLVVVNPALYEG